MSRSPRQSPLHAQKHNRLLKQIQEIYALYQKGQLTQAQAQITRLIAKEPKSSHAQTLASMVCASTGQHDRALYHAQTAIKLDPSNPDAQSTLASIYSLNGKHEEARTHYELALSAAPQHPGALSGLGSTLSQLGEYSKARATLQAVHELTPDLPDPLVNRALLELDTTHAHRAIEILENAPAPLQKHPAVLDLRALAYSYDDTKTREQVYQAHKDYGDELETHIPPQRHSGIDLNPDRKLKIGYLSGDLHRHSITYFLEPILRHTDNSSFETHVFTTSAHRDEVTERLNDCADHWHDCSTKPAQELSKFIKDQGIDILVELTGHFAGHKLSVFASKPAPIQITFIGYGNTTGLSRIDARFVDEITDPTPDTDALATETLVRLDGCFLCYQPPKLLPIVREPDTDRPFTIGSFNNLKKLSDSTIKVWVQILEQREQTKLLIKSSKLANDEFRTELIERFSTHGIDQSRLDLRAFSETVESHLDTYNELDLALDTFPYTGTTTTCESLAMGVPVLTLLGNAHAGRVSASLLSTVGLQELIAADESAYITKAIDRIDAGKWSMEQRGLLRDQMLGSPLCEQEPYTRKVLDAYRTLWTRLSERSS
ncbi:MAG: tetratricopeptide repeat protein [Phycisphaerales bacterium]